MPSIPTLSIAETSTALAEALHDAGCAVVRDVVAPDVRERLQAELRPHVEIADPEAGRALNALYVADGLGYPDFYAGNTRRVISLVRKSPTLHDLATHPVTAAACDATLKPACVAYQVHATAALYVEPGADRQVLHREEDPFVFLPLPRPNLVTASMWAMSDFTAANGATRLVPGSHRWPPDRVADEGEIVAAEMPAGSVLFWTGRVLHGAGANRTSAVRYGLFVSFSVGWVRQEENLYLEIPLADALELPKPVRELIGYRMHAGLGFSEAYW